MSKPGPVFHEKLLVEQDGPLGWLVFNAPERRNAVSLEMWEALPKIIEHFNQNAEIRIILLKGAGAEAFVAGADISEFKELRSNLATAKRYNHITDQAFLALRESQKPVIAMIRGFCFGGGCAIAVNCDLRIASHDAKFAIPAAKLGIAYGYTNVQQVVNVVGLAYAREMLYTARTYTAEEALRMGLIHHQVAASALEDFTIQYARQITENAPLSIQAVKIAIGEYLKAPLQRSEHKIEESMARCFESADYQEGYQAFLEKRKPVFKGC